MLRAASSRRFMRAATPNIDRIGQAARVVQFRHQLVRRRQRSLAGTDVRQIVALVLTGLSEQPMALATYLLTWHLATTRAWNWIATMLL